MKSVSFSDLRKSSEVYKQANEIKQDIIDKGLFQKGLTFYSNTEDVLRRFSSKTSQLKTLKKDEDNCIKITNPMSELQDLNARISEQNKIISSLQDQNIMLQNDFDKISDEIKYQRNRITYLEKLLEVFKINLPKNESVFPSSSNIHLLSENVVYNNTPTDNYRDIQISSNEGNQNKNDKSFNFHYRTDIPNNFDKRLNSTDFIFQNQHQCNNHTFKEDMRSKSIVVSTGSYSNDRKESQSFLLDDSANNFYGTVPKQLNLFYQVTKSDVLTNSNQFNGILSKVYGPKNANQSSSYNNNNIHGNHFNFRCHPYESLHRTMLGEECN